jgi:hypothetical protein
VFGAEADWQWANLTGNSGAVPAPGIISDSGNKVTISDIRAGLSFKFGGY